jgi:hypothetical protein
LSLTITDKLDIFGDSLKMNSRDLSLIFNEIAETPQAALTETNLLDVIEYYDVPLAENLDLLEDERKEWCKELMNSATKSDRG